METIPSIYEIQDVGAMGRFDGRAFQNDLLRPGEVKRIIYPDDPRSRTRKFTEYDVLVQHRENDTAVTKMYHNCFVSNPLGGIADHAVWTLRPDDRQNAKGDVTGLGVGSKVLLLCINGEHAQAVVIGGIRDDKDRDDKALGHHLDFEFNGVRFRARDDGSWILENLGKTKADGAADPKRDSGAGTTLEVKANGEWQVRTAGGKQSVTIDHQAGTIKVDAENQLELVANRINIGQGASSPAVLGDTWMQLMTELIQLIIAQAYPTAVGPTTGPSLAAPALQALALRLQTALSTQTFVKLAPR